MGFSFLQYTLLVLLSFNRYKCSLRNLDSNNSLTSSDKLTSGYSINSQDGSYNMYLDNYGTLNILENKSSKIVWSSPQANGVAPYEFSMDESGNLLIKDKNGISTWNMTIKAGGTSPFILILGNDGILQVFDKNQKSFWSSSSPTSNTITNGCINLYVECDFSGSKIELCSDTATLDPKYKSIVLASGVNVRVYTKVKFEGEFVEISQNVSCLSSINLDSKILSLKFSNKICLSKEYLNNGVCQACPSKCSTCQSDSICLSCINLYTLSNNSCILKCKSNQYDNNGLCADCSSNCVTCSSYNFCTSCDNGKKVSQLGVCEKICLSNQYADGDACHNCPNYCTTCSTAQICTACLPNAKLTSQYTCAPLCNSSQYVNSIGNCENCANSCKTCMDQSNCLTCQDGLVYLNGLCTYECTSGYVKVNGVCQKISSCPQGYFQDFKNNGDCIQCPDHCISCVNSNSCSECDGNFTLLGLDKTSNKYYEVTAGVSAGIDGIGFELKTTEGQSVTSHLTIGSTMCANQDALDVLLSHKILKAQISMVLILVLLS